MGAKLDDCVDIQSGGQGFNTTGEPHWLTSVLSPVSAVHPLVRSHRFSSHVADQGERRLGYRNVIENCLEIVERRFHEGAVIRGAGAETPHVNAAGFQLVGEGVHLSGRSADDLVGAVVDAYGEVRSDMDRPPLGNCFGHRGSRGENSGHGPGTREIPHKPPAGGGKLHPIFQAEHAGGLGSGYLSQAVSQHRDGSNADAFPQGGEGTFQGVNGWLSPPGLVEIAFRAGPPEHNIQEGCSPFLPDAAVAAVHHCAKDGLVPVQCFAHAHPLVALAGVDKCDPGGPLEWRGIRGFGDGFQALGQGAGIPKNQGVPEVEVASCHAGGPGQVAKG